MTLYSHSRLSTFEQCPLRFKFQYLDKVKPDFVTTIEAFLGDMVHRALEQLYKDAKFKKLLTQEELLNVYTILWETNWSDDIHIVRTEYMPEQYKAMGEQFIKDYYQTHHPFDESKTLGLETQDTVALNDQHKLHVRIDRLAVKDGVFEIHDYKTANSLPSQQQADNDRQLAIYAYGIKHKYPTAKKIKLIWHYLAFNQALVSERTDEQLEQMRKDTLQLIETIERTTSFPPKRSALCNWCGFRSRCPLFKHLIKISKQDTLHQFIKDDGVALVNAYAQLAEDIKQKEARLEIIKEDLLAYAQKENLNAVYGSNKKVTITRYEKLGFPGKNDVLRTSFEKTIKQLGLWDKLSTVDVYELAKMINAGEIHPELVSVLDRFVTKEPRTIVRVGKR